MKRSRIIGFVLSILIGLAAGLFYGWVINPTGVKNSTLDTLRSDYKTDYVLMIAEAYTANQDAETVLKMLEEISAEDPYKAVQQALLSAEELNYSEREMRALINLETAFSSGIITFQAGTP